MICWALGAFGLALTGVLEANTKEDMAAHSRTILLWGANLPSQPTTAPNFISDHTVGFEAFANHLNSFTPEWAEPHTGIAAERIRSMPTVKPMYKRFRSAHPVTISPIIWPQSPEP